MLLLFNETAHQLLQLHTLGTLLVVVCECHWVFVLTSGNLIHLLSAAGDETRHELLLWWPGRNIL